MLVFGLFVMATGLLWILRIGGEWGLGVHLERGVWVLGE